MLPMDIKQVESFEIVKVTNSFKNNTENEKDGGKKSTVL